MEKKYFFFDIDGTLTDRSTGKIVPSAALALSKLRDAGHFVAINMVCNGGKAIVIDKMLVENSPLVYENALRLYYDALKAAADEIAPANVDDGIYKVCQKNGWF